MITLSENFSEPTVIVVFFAADDDDDFDEPQALMATTTTRPTAAAFANRWIRMLEASYWGVGTARRASAAPAIGSFLTESRRLSPFGVIQRWTSASPTSVPRDSTATRRAPE